MEQGTGIFGSPYYPVIAALVATGGLYLIVRGLRRVFGRNEQDDSDLADSLVQAHFKVYVGIMLFVMGVAYLLRYYDIATWY